MSDADDELWRERLSAVRAVAVRTGQDPRWKRLGDASEMGVLSGMGWAVWLAEHGIAPRLVPSEYWSLDADIGDEPVAVVACPCANEPTVGKRAAPALCEGPLCERSFFFDGDDVWCFNTPTQDTAVE